MRSRAPLRGGIIGCGFFAQFHIEAWRRMNGIELVAAADPDLRRANDAAPHAYSSAEELFNREKLDFVDIATRPEWHSMLVKMAAARGIPVICQKPLAPTWELSVEIVEAAETARVPFMVHENWRWQPWYREVQKRISSGSIGNPISYTFRTRRRDGLGEAPYPAQPYFSRMPRFLILETLVHQIDTSRFVYGDVQSVYARTRRNNAVIAGEDQAILVTTHQSGLSGVIDGHRFAETFPDGPVMGDALFEGEEAVLSVKPTGDVYLGGAERVWENTVHEGYRGDSVRATQQHFIDCLRDGKRFETNGREYLKTVRAVEAAYQSAGSGAAVAL